MRRIIAERKLLFSEKGSSHRLPLSVQISEPYLLLEGEVDFPVHDGASGCLIEFQGLDDFGPEEVHGADAIQALQFAVEIDPILKHLSKRYDLYYPSGESYFE